MFTQKYENILIVTKWLQNILSNLDFYYVKKTTTKRARKAFGKRIKQLRKEQGITQDQLAYESELSRVEIARIETGARGASFETMLSLSKGFNIPLKELLDFDFKE